MNKLKSTNLASKLLTLISSTKETREALNIVPTFTTRLQAALTLGVSRKQIDKVAKELEQEGKIRFGDTMNDKYYELLPAKEDPDGSAK